MGKTVGEGIGKCILASVLIPLPAQVLRILNEPMNNRTRALNKFFHLFFFVEIEIRQSFREIRSTIEHFPR